MLLGPQQQFRNGSIAAVVFVMFGVLLFILNVVATPSLERCRTHVVILRDVHVKPITKKN